MRGKTAEDQNLLELLDPVAEAAGYAIVRLRLMGGEHARKLQVMAERQVDGDMNVEDCARLSRAISEIMDAADPIAGEYTLEVSSPGVDRPLTRLADFETYQGHEARIELDRLAEGRKRFKGMLAGVDDEPGRRRPGGRGRDRADPVRLDRRGQARAHRPIDEAGRRRPRSPLAIRIPTTDFRVRGKIP